jgi:hypothetical protein
VEPRAPFDRSERVVQKSQIPAAEERTKDRTYDRQPVREYSSYTPVNQNSALMSGISGNKICGEHPDEEILYYCFDCKCECICPECIIHGIFQTIQESTKIMMLKLSKNPHRQLRLSYKKVLIRSKVVLKIFSSKKVR